MKSDGVWCARMVRIVARGATGGTGAVLMSAYERLMTLTEGGLSPKSGH